jgi:oligoendopeptidase F
VDYYGDKPLKPFKTEKELVSKIIRCFDRTGYNLGKYPDLMYKSQLLDLGSRKGKAPGGYNYPLDRTGAPFIFMNAAGRLQDVVTMAHEGGHAIHSFLTRDLDLVYFKHTPSEVAELASMSMELISMDGWDEFFKNDEDLKRARKKHLAEIIEIFPWIAIIDKFQHWIYTHPAHSNYERDEEWLKIYDEFSSGLIDWTGFEPYRRKLWQRQGHLFEVPFYYIEYAIAQLGAIAVWKNYKENREKGLLNYLEALKLGHTRSIPEIYEKAGIKFDFSTGYIRSLMSFIKKQYENL